MTDLELIALFAGSWIAAAAIWMLLDWAARPKHARFRPKGDRIHRGPFSYRHFRRVRRAEENEEVRLRIEQRYGRPTLALRQKRRLQVLARHDRLVTGIGTNEALLADEALLGDGALVGAGVGAGAAETDSESELAAGNPSDNTSNTADAAGHDEADTTVAEPVYWTAMRDKAMGFDAQNDERLAKGEPPVRYNPVLRDDEAMAYDGTTGAWPTHTVDPFAHTAEQDVDTADTDAPSSSDDESDTAIERAVRDLEHLPEAG